MQSQDKDLGNAFRLEKVISLKVPTREHGKYSLCRFVSGNLYILTEDFHSKKQVMLFKTQINSGEFDTFFLQLSLHDISDFNVYGKDVILMINGNFLCYNLDKKQYSRIYVPGVVGYRHFYPKDGNSVYMYEWLIGDRYEERKDVTLYNMKSDSFRMLYPLTLTGINFMGIYRGHKYMDVKHSLIARGKASSYSILMRRIGSSETDTLRRPFKSSEFISESFIEMLHTGYSGKRMLAVSDSLDKHCKDRRLIHAMKLASDSILYVHYKGRSAKCEWLDSNSVGYLDVWKFDPVKKSWKLVLADIRPDNRAVCAKPDLARLKKDMIGFSLTGPESEWMVDGSRLLIPKLMTDKVDIDDNLSRLNSRSNHKGPQNLHVFVYRLR